MIRARLWCIQERNYVGFLPSDLPWVERRDFVSQNKQIHLDFGVQAMQQGQATEGEGLSIL